jgi:hypothetical protein
MRENIELIGVIGDDHPAAREFWKQLGRPVLDQGLSRQRTTQLLPVRLRNPQKRTAHAVVDLRPAIGAVQPDVVTRFLHPLILMQYARA